jgi:serine/threonine protein kinase
LAGLAARALHGRRRGAAGENAARQRDDAHARGIIYGDLKPGNVICDGRGDVVLTEFGIARGPSRITTQGGVVLRTPADLAPEQALNETPLTQQATSRPCCPASQRASSWV